MGFWNFFTGKDPQKQAAPTAPQKLSFWGRIKKQLLGHDLADLSVLDQLEEQLIQADLGVDETQHILALVKKKWRHHTLTLPLLEETIKTYLIDRLEAIQKQKKTLSQNALPTVILVVGVNGVGKTTSIGKLTHLFTQQGDQVVLGAGDTFRAAAYEQLRVWHTRSSQTLLVGGETHKDPAAVAYLAVQKGISVGANKVIIDTAGRLHTKKHLMDELGKVGRVAGKLLPGAPHHVWLVVDGTMGQNAFSQAQFFNEAVRLTGLVVTKLDGLAKGGSILRIATHLQLPIYYVGTGEQADAIQPFNTTAYIKALFSN